MSYITLNNTNMIGPQGVRKSVVVRKLNTQQYGFKMYISDEYFGIQWLDGDEKRVLAESKNFIFSKLPNATLTRFIEVND